MTRQADPGSFRDPMSRVFVDDQAVWRGLRADGLVEYEALAGSAFFREAIERGDVVATERVRDTRLPGEWAAVLRHERVEVISFAYEWPFEMLRDAALLQLSLTRAALRDGFITKDASAYNVQFIGAKPIFIDVGSFERLRASEPWPGYRQFCELFLNPLLIQALRDVSFQPLLRGNVNGIAPRVAAEILGGEGRFNKTVLMHVKLHARAERKYADSDRERDVKAELTRAGFGPSVIDAQLKSLEKAVAGLTWTRQGSTWSEYSDRSHYDTSDMQCKERFVAKAVASRSVGQVLDLGANDGHFSRVALRAGARSVVAVDSDDLVIDRLYRDLRREGERRVLPLVIDLADPSPGLGWRSRERPPFIERVRPDLVLCLAIVHHLALTHTVPLPAIVDFLADFSAAVVVEFPHHDDPMAARLLTRKRAGVFDGYRQAHWEHALAERFSVLDTETLPSGTRTLYHCSLR